MGRFTALALNDAGDVVGDGAFLYTDREGLVDLNTRLGTRKDWVLKRAAHINNAGQIVGYGLHNGQERAFRLTPIRNRHGRATPVHTYP